MTALLVRGERPGLTRPEQWLRGAAALLALTSTGFAVWYLVKGLATESQYPYAANSVAKDLLLVGLSALVFWDVRRWAAIAVPLIVLVHVAMPVIMLVVGTKHGINHTWIGPPEGRGRVPEWLARGRRRRRHRLRLAAPPRGPRTLRPAIPPALRASGR